MKFSGSVSQIDNETKMLNWISANINNTGFTSYLDAETEWNNIKAQGETVILNNKPFFAELSISTRQDFVVLLPEIEPEVQPTNACMDACTQVFLSSGASASEDFALALQTGASDYGMSGDGQTFSQLIVIKKMTYQIAIDIARDEYIDCTIDCI